MRYFRIHGQAALTDAVIVKFSGSPDGPLAEVAWPGNDLTPPGDYLYPTGVPLALDRARDVMTHYGFSRIAVLLPAGFSWNAVWGDLVDEGNS